MTASRETGWGIDPAEGVRHVAVFELAQPLSCSPKTPCLSSVSTTPAGSTASAGCGCPRHPPSRRSPCPHPKRSSSCAAPCRRPRPAACSPSVTRSFVSRILTGRATARAVSRSPARSAGKPAAFEPVVNNGMYAAPWQTWRLPVAPSDTPQSFELRPHHLVAGQCRTPLLGALRAGEWQAHGQPLIERKRR